MASCLVFSSISVKQHSYHVVYFWNKVLRELQNSSWSYSSTQVQAYDFILGNNFPNLSRVTKCMFRQQIYWASPVSVAWPCTARCTPLMWEHHSKSGTVLPFLLSNCRSVSMWVKQCREGVEKGWGFPEEPLAVSNKVVFKGNILFSDPLQVCHVPVLKHHPMVTLHRCKRSTFWVTTVRSLVTSDTCYLR